MSTRDWYELTEWDDAEAMMPTGIGDMRYVDWCRREERRHLAHSGDVWVRREGLKCALVRRIA